MKSLCAAAALVLAAFASPAFGQSSGTMAEEEAAAKYAAQDWPGTVEAYGALLEGDAENASYLYYLARAQHELGQYEGAEKNYLKALDKGFATPAFAQYQLARLYMSWGKKKKALATLEALAETGGVPGAFLKSTAEFAPLAEDRKFLAVVQALTPCTDPEYRHFDFWLGEWDVTSAGSSGPSASNSISSQHGGCVVLEQYTAGAFTGMSINFYDSNDAHWHQTWMSNSGGALYIKGGLDENGAMVMSDKGLVESETINRITWTPNDDGSVRQHWETSTDEETWTTVFDGTYTKKAEAE